MNKRQFLDIFRAERLRLEKLLAVVGPERMHIAGVSGIYSTKDILAHLEAYDRALVVWLKEARAGRVYVDELLDRPDQDARNAVVYEANKDRSAADILQTFYQTLDELEDRIELLSYAELTNADITAWFVVPRWQRKQALWQCIANDSYEHHQQHSLEIELWLEEKGSED